MYRFQDYCFVAFLVLLSSSTIAAGKTNKIAKSCENQCYIQRIHRLLSADCYNKTCKRFPRYLQSDVEIIDAAFNRIREITADDLKPYTSLQYLYLGDNMITKIHPDAFADKDDLVALDLSWNAFSSPSAIPEVIFHLPSLKHLYLSQNQNINIVEAIESAAPIRAPLESLDIAYNNYDEAWNTLPIMGMVPTLIKYNVSGMSLILNTSEFAGLCNLEIWVNSNVTAEFVDPCDCWNLDKWLKERKVKFDSFTAQCMVKETECEYSIPSDDMDTFTSCKKTHAEQVYQTKLNKSLLIGGCILGVLLIVLIIGIWRWRRTRDKRRRESNRLVRQPNEFAPMNEYETH